MSFTCRVELDAPERKVSAESLGIDLGVENSVALSTGELISFPVLTPEQEAHVRRLRTRVNRCERGSRNRSKARARLERYLQRARRRREHAMHTLALRLVREADLIGIENLHVQNMTRSATGTVEAPGVNVAQKRGLNRVILSQAWGEFRRILTYKATWHGSQVVVVPAAYSSQECAACGYVARENRESQAVFKCMSPACEHATHADVNAAMTIRNRAKQLAAARTAGFGTLIVPLPTS